MPKYKNSNFWQVFFPPIYWCFLSICQTLSFHAFISPLQQPYWFNHYPFYTQEELRVKEVKYLGEGLLANQ